MKYSVWECAAVIWISELLAYKYKRQWTSFLSAMRKSIKLNVPLLRYE